MRIIDLHPGYDEMIHQAAVLLMESFREEWPEAWSDLESATREVGESLAEGRLSRIAVDEQGTVLGWIGGIATYDGRVWEVHPLVVNPATRGEGIGRELMEDLERQALLRGGLTLWVGTDDESGATSLGGVDLYPQPLEHLLKIKNLHRHPYEFYQKLDFVIVGVMPDANGPGKPDIYLAKRIRAGSSRQVEESE